MSFQDINPGQQFDIKGAIVRTIAYFDMFDYPLTAMEIWRGVELKFGFPLIVDTLERGINRVESQNGFYFLSGRSEIIRTRLGRYNGTDRKFKRALKLSRLYKFIPWIRMIAIGNLMGSQNLKEDGDIDLFIVAASGRLWLTRFFCVSIAKILGWRPQPGKNRDKICLSFFISEAALDLRPLMLAPASRPDRPAEREDVYFIYWLAGLAPLYGIPGFYEKFFTANRWLKDYLPNWHRSDPPDRRDAGDPWPKFYAQTADRLFGGLESRFKNWQLDRLPAAIKDMMNRDTRVIVNDQIIKLHVNDRREEYREKYLMRLKN